MASYSNKFKCVLHFNDKEEGFITYDDMMYSLLVDMVVKRFNLDLNFGLNLSFNLPSIEMDITDDQDVKFLFDCASNCTDGIPHLCVDVTEGGYDNVMPTKEYVKKVIEDVFENDHFTSGPWLSAVVYLHGEGVIAYGCLGDMKTYCKNGKLERAVGVVMTCTPNALGDMTITLKDLSGTMGGSIHFKVFQQDEGYARSIKVENVLILRNVSVFTPKPSNHYLNITLRNIIKVFDKDTEFKSDKCLILYLSIYVFFIELY
ncbi:reverse transcriptase domain-containing protein [Tanacetum coccineum]